MNATTQTTKTIDTWWQCHTKCVWLWEHKGDGIVHQLFGFGLTFNLSISQLDSCSNNNVSIQLSSCQQGRNLGCKGFRLLFFREFHISIIYYFIIYLNNHLFASFIYTATISSFILKHTSMLSWSTHVNYPLRTNI